MTTVKKKVTQKGDNVLAETVREVEVLAILFSTYYSKLGNTEVALSNAKMLLETLKTHVKS